MSTETVAFLSGMGAGSLLTIVVIGVLVSRWLDNFWP